MVLILTHENDHSTGEVIRWLNFYNEPYLRINENQSVIIKSLTHNNLVFSFKEKSYSLSEIKSIWYRRGNFNIGPFTFKLEEDDDNLLQHYNESEIIQLTAYIHNLFKAKKNLNNFNNSSVNKLAVLKYCKENNLNSSNFIVTQSKSELLKFYNKEKKIISKAIGNQFLALGKTAAYNSYTYLAKDSDIKRLPNYFTPTFFQSNVDKKYEIRTFYIDGDFYSMAIFSQRNSQTKVDFRHYDHGYPNMTSPYQLPEEYEKKLDKMLKEFEINCASLDTLISREGTHHMIDINPIGQFGMTSHPCNYNLEKKIAEFLI